MKFCRAKRPSEAIFLLVILLFFGLLSACGKNVEATAPATVPPESPPATSSAAATRAEEDYYTPTPISADSFSLYEGDDPRIIFQTREFYGHAVNKALAFYESIRVLPAEEGARFEGKVFHMAFEKDGKDVASFSLSENSLYGVYANEKTLFYRTEGNALFENLQRLYLDNKYYLQDTGRESLSAEALALPKIQTKFRNGAPPADVRLSRLNSIASFDVSDRYIYILWNAVVRLLPADGQPLAGQPTAAGWAEKEILVPILHERGTSLATLLDDSYCANIRWETYENNAAAVFMGALYEDPEWSFLYQEAPLWFWFAHALDKQNGASLVAAGGRRYGSAAFHKGYTERARHILETCQWEAVEAPSLSGATFGLAFSPADALPSVTLYEGDFLCLRTDTGDFWLKGTPLYEESAYDAFRFDFDTAEASLYNITLKTTEKDFAKIARQFMEEWGKHLRTNLSPGSKVAVRRFAVMGDPYVYDTKEGDDTIFAFGVSYAVIPVGGLGFDLFWWPGNTTYGEGKWEGWLTMGRGILLSRNEQGEWVCLEIGTGGVMIPPEGEG